MSAAPSPSIEYRDGPDIPRDDLMILFAACLSPAAEKPDQLLAALNRADAVVTAWSGRRLVGLASALTDGQLVVYYSHVLVHPEQQQFDIGHQLIRRLMSRYADLPQHVLLTNSEIEFTWDRLGFRPARRVSVMWIGEGAVPDAARVSLPSTTTPPRFWQVLTGSGYSRRHKAAINLLGLQLLAAIIAALFYFGEDESPVLTGPALAAIGAAFAIVTWPIRTWTTLLFGLSAPFTIGAGAVLAALNGGEFLAIVLLYVCLLLPAAPFALAQIVGWPSDYSSSTKTAEPPAAMPWQFSMQAILWVMTGVAIFFALCHPIFRVVQRDELRFVALFGVLNLAFCGALLGRFLYEKARAPKYASRSA